MNSDTINDEKAGFENLNNIINKSEIIETNQNDGRNEKENETKSDSVTNRVAGFKLKKIFAEHTSSVTAITVVEHQESKKNYLLSAGWDRLVFMILSSFHFYFKFHYIISGKFVFGI
jgi:hypothetical protein